MRAESVIVLKDGKGLNAMYQLTIVNLQIVLAEANVSQADAIVKLAGRVPNAMKVKSRKYKLVVIIGG